MNLLPRNNQISKAHLNLASPIFSCLFLLSKLVHFQACSSEYHLFSAAMHTIYSYSSPLTAMTITITPCHIVSLFSLAFITIWKPSEKLSFLHISVLFDSWVGILSLSRRRQYIIRICLVLEFWMASNKSLDNKRFIQTCTCVCLVPKFEQLEIL